MTKPSSRVVATSKAKPEKPTARANKRKAAARANGKQVHEIAPNLPPALERTIRSRAVSVCDNVLQAIGGTPLIRLTRFVGSGGPDVYVKTEASNPGGSSKDRSAVAMIEAAERAGKVKPGGQIIVSTSGNMGVGMAMVCAVKGLKLTCLVDPKISAVNEAILQLYGADIVKVFKRDPQGGYHLTRLQKVKELRKRYPDAHYIDQYDNENNALAHYSSTAPEILEALDGKVDAVVVAAGTGGTLMGVARYFKEKSPSTHIWAIDEHGSLALPANRIPQLRFLNGMGTGIRPPNYDYVNFDKYVDKQHYVTASQALQTSVELARSEGLLTGGSGGAVAYVMKHVMVKAYAKGRSIVGILPDHGSRYVDSFFNKEWLAVREISVPALE
jgi:N-(2-amino-2-carboxyethyl)-L-glutamate synthase